MDLVTTPPSGVCLVVALVARSSGDRPTTVCLSSEIARSDRRSRSDRLSSAPWGSDDLVVTWDAVSLADACLVEGWRPPGALVDLAVEFRAATNGVVLRYGGGLGGALAYYGLDVADGIDSARLAASLTSRQPLSAAGHDELVPHADRRLGAVRRLWRAMSPAMDLEGALRRGRFLVALAAVEHAGLPIDVSLLPRLRAGWAPIRAAAQARGLTPIVNTSRPEVSVGCDGRNRVDLRPFSSSTGRCQPGKGWILGLPRYLRGLVRADDGMALIHADWRAHELGVAAALSRDPAMIAAYESGDPYRFFAERTGGIRAGMTASDVTAIRAAYKRAMLAISYGAGPDTVGRALGRPAVYGEDLLRRHRETFRRFWRWSDGIVDHALLHGEIWTPLGWRLHSQQDPSATAASAAKRVRAIRNFVVQGAAAETLQVAVTSAVKRGIRVVAVNHDALIAECPVGRLDATRTALDEAMGHASAAVLAGFRLATEVQVVMPGERMVDRDSATTWAALEELLAEVEHEEGDRAPVHHHPRTGEHPSISYMSVRREREGHDV